MKPHPKPKFGKKAKNPTKTHRARWSKLVSLGCVINNHECKGEITIHHCFTGAGGRKNHDKVIPLCWKHHLSYECGIDGRGKFSKKTWQEHYNTEKYYLDEINLKLSIDIL